MAQLKITSNLAGLTPAEAAQRAAKYPHAGKPQAGPRIDGDAFDIAMLDLSRRSLVTPDDKLWTIPDGQTMWSDPRTSEVVKSWEKAHLYNVRKKGDGWKGDIRLTGRGAEYDRYVFSLSKDDAARLGPDGVDRSFREFLTALRTSPYGSGSRMLEVEPLHQTEDGHLHIHVTAHRHAVDPAGAVIRRGISQGEVHDKEAERLVAAMGAPILIEYMNEGGGRGVSEEAREDTSEAIREAGGEPTPEMAGAKESVSEWAMPAAEQTRIEQALREVERRMARREEERRADANLFADLQNGLSAIREREALTGALATTERQRGELAEQLSATIETLAEATAAKDATAAELAAEREALALTSQHLEQAETRLKRLESELDATTDRAETAEAGLEEVRQEVASLTADGDRLAGQITELIGQVEAANERATTAEAERDQVRQEVASLTERAEAAEAEAAERAQQTEATRAELTTLREMLVAAQAERSGLAASLDAIRAALATTEGALASEKEAHAAFKEQAREAEEADAVPPGGTGFDGVTVDRRRRDPSISWPKGVEARRGFFGRVRLETRDGAVLRIQRGAIRVASGGLTPIAVAAMLAHAQREGWSSIAVTGDDKARAALTKAARAAGLTLDGDDAPGLSPADPKPSPTPAPAGAGEATPPARSRFEAKAPDAWTKRERRDAEEAFRRAQEKAPAGSPLHAMTVEDWGKAVNARWSKDNPEAATDDGSKPKPPKPE